MHQLQVELRRYVIQEKDKGRMERLNKWKEEFMQESTSNDATFRQLPREPLEFKLTKTDRRSANELNE